MKDKGSEITMSSELDLRQFHISCETGFLLPNPLSELPPYFDEWNKLARSAHTLYEAKSLREAVDKLPLLNADLLRGDHQLRLAHLQLSLLMSGYVWQDGDSGVVKVLPRSVSVPYWKISQQLGVQPILAYSDVVLANWGLVEPERPFDFNNVTCLYHAPGGKSADWFCTVLFMVEQSFAQCLNPIVQIVSILKTPKNSTDNTKTTEDEHNERSNHWRDPNLITSLRAVHTGIQAMHTSLLRMREHLDVKDFFNVVRPFFNGWGGAGNPLPEGLVFEGVSDVPVKSAGANTAQSSTFQVLDALLGVVHSQEKKEFLQRMRECMPLGHRQFLEYLEQHPCKLRDEVAVSQNPDLKSCYNQCLQGLSDLRQYHLTLVKMYTVIPARLVNEKKHSSLDNRGTGGTSPVPFLKEILLDTKQRLLPADQRANPAEKITSLAKEITISGKKITSPTESSFYSGGGLLCLVMLTSACVCVALAIITFGS